MPTNHFLVLCTCPDRQRAGRLADTLIADKLAACVNILPGILSVYPWKNQIETAEEVLLLIKTQKQCYGALEAHIKANHPYELPEIIAVPIEVGHAPYLQWIAEWLDKNN